MSLNSSIVIFDGVCNLCNFWVDFLIKRDQKGIFLFTANQDQAGKEILETHEESAVDVSTIYLLEKDVLYKESSAVLRVARKLPGLWPLLYGLILIPRPIRDAVYKWVAKNRYRWFGQKETCRIPTAEERARFL